MKNYVNIDGKMVIDLTPSTNENPLALVDLAVLNKLTQLLPKDNFSNIRHMYRSEIMQADKLEILIQISENFISFHKSINLIREVCQSEINMSEPSIVGKIELDAFDH